VSAVVDGRALPPVAVSVDAARRARLRDCTVLLVDDEEANLDLLEALLAGEGYTRLVRTADAREVPALDARHAPDLVLLDLHMPHRHGLAVLGDLRAATPAGDYRPVLVLTADATEEARDRALALGARDFVTKPFDAAEVLLRVENLLDTRVLHVEERRARERAEAAEARSALLAEWSRLLAASLDPAYRARAPAAAAGATVGRGVRGGGAGGRRRDARGRGLRRRLRRDLGAGAARSCGGAVRRAAARRRRGRGGHRRGPGPGWRAARRRAHRHERRPGRRARAGARRRSRGHCWTRPGAGRRARGARGARRRARAAARRRGAGHARARAPARGGRARSPEPARRGGDVRRDAHQPAARPRGRSDADTGVAAYTRRALATIHTSTVAMQRLVEDLLDASSLRGDALRVHRSEQRVGAPFEVADRMLRPLANAAGITLVVQGEGDAAERLGAIDGERVVQLLSNLVGNAVKFTPPGGTIHVRYGVDDGELTASVADTGPGIAPDELPHLFTAFWRGDRDGARGREDGRGAGLGLWIARAIVEAHDGALRVDSRPGEGATFHFTLPLADPGRRWED
jgi:signal transduction histidine kinase